MPTAMTRDDPERGGGTTTTTRPRRRWSSNRSDPCVWAVSLLLNLVAVAVVLSMLTILAVVFVVKPHEPYVNVRDAEFHGLGYIQSRGLLDVQLSFALEARNRNSFSSGTFTRLGFRVSFAGASLADFRQDGPLVVPPKGVLPVPFGATVRGAPLNDFGTAAMEDAVRQHIVTFQVQGEARVRWQVAGLFFIKQWTRLACELNFNMTNAATIPFECSSRSKFIFF